MTRSGRGVREPLAYPPWFSHVMPASAAAMALAMNSDIGAAFAPAALLLPARDSARLCEAAGVLVPEAGGFGFDLLVLVLVLVGEGGGRLSSLPPKTLLSHPMVNVSVDGWGKAASDKFRRRDNDVALAAKLAWAGAAARLVPCLLPPVKSGHVPG